MIAGDHYQLLEQIGEGSFGKVYRAIETNTKMPVAIKYCETDSPELSLFPTLSHPNIPLFFQSLDEDAIVMEYCSGGDLKNFLESRGPFPELKARRYFQQIVSVVDYLHNVKHVVHRDLKLENILLDENDNVKVTDFGLSISVKQAKRSSITVGSPRYFSPEIFMTSNSTSAESSEMWSLGVLLHYMVAGYPPFNGEDIDQLKLDVTASPLIIPSGLFSPDLTDLITGLLQKSWTSRFTLDDVKRSDWLSASSLRPVTFVEEIDQTLEAEVDRFHLNGDDRMAVLRILSLREMKNQKIRSKLSLSMDNIQIGSPGFLTKSKLSPIRATPIIRIRAATKVRIETPQIFS